MSRYRYGVFDDGPDPLAAPYDVRHALDALGDKVLSGDRPGDALRDLLHRGADGRRGLNDLRRDALRRAKELRKRGRADGTLEEVRRLLDTAIGQERAALFADPSDDARFREARLDAVPSETARAVADLREYDWQSPQAAATYQEIRDLLRREVLDSRFAGMKQALGEATLEDLARVKNMLAELNEMLAADERGELTQDQFDEFMGSYGDFFPDNPQNLAELVDSLARRMAAAQRLMDSLNPEQRAELSELAAGVFDDLGVAAEMSRLTDALRALRPDLDWDRGSRLTGSQPLGLGDATTALQELADLEELAATLGQDYPGADLTDVDDEAVRRALGRCALDDLDALRRIQRELEEQGWLNRSAGRLELTPKAIRRIGQSALRRVFASLSAHRPGSHDMHSAGAAGELTGASRPWQFGDAQPLDVVRTLTNAITRGGATEHGITLDVADFEVAETERPGRGVGAAGRLVLHGTAGHLCGREDHGPGPARAGHRYVSRRRGATGGVLPARHRDHPHRLGHPRAGLRPGHQPAARAAAVRPLPGPSPRHRENRAGGHRRRAHRAPDPRRWRVVRLATVPGDAHPDLRPGRWPVEPH